MKLLDKTSISVIDIWEISSRNIPDRRIAIIRWQVPFEKCKEHSWAQLLATAIKLIGGLLVSWSNEIGKSYS